MARQDGTMGDNNKDGNDNDNDDDDNDDNDDDKDYDGDGGGGGIVWSMAGYFWNERK